VTVSSEPFLKSVTVEASDIEKYYETNADQFKTAEQVRVQFLELKAGAVDRNYRPDEAELKRIYDEEIARFVTPEKRRLSHILLTLPEGASDAEVRQTLGRIQEIEKKLRAGADFAQLAKQHSQDGDSARKGGDLGEWRPGLLPKTLEQPALSLKLRETSKPVRSEYGYHLLKLTAHTPEKRKTLAEVKAELTKQLQARRAEERFVDLAEKMRNLVYEQPDSLEAAANTLELEVQSSDWFTRSGGSGVARNLKVVEAAFHPEVISKSRNSDVVELDGQTMVALRVVDHRPSVRRPLAEVRIEIERTLRQRAAQEKTVALTQEWIKELRVGASLEKLAASRGLRTSGEKKITRERTTGLDRRIVESAFRAAPPPAGRQEYGVADLGSQGQAVFVLSRVIDTPPERLETAIRDKARRQLAERRGQGFYAAYRAGLRLNADVQILNDRL
jgi:peptidyl-prolyl cis-trans isomerase D